MPQIEDTTWESSFTAPVRNIELERYAKRELGIPSPAAQFFGDCPWLVHMDVAMNPHRGNLLHVELELADKILLVVSQENSCRYCFAAARVVLHVLGHSEDHIRRLEQDLLHADMREGERAALNFARRLTRANPLLTSADLQPLRHAHFESGAIKEIALMAALSGWGTRIYTFVAAPPEQLERFPNSMLTRMLARLLIRRATKLWSRGETVVLQPEEMRGPYAYLVEALNGLPYARNLRTSLDAAWASPILPPRTKALICAVIARTLGCGLSEKEAVRLLADDGFTQEDVNDLLAHLTSPKLDPLEALIVPFARETVWYQPAPLQRRVKELQQHLTPAQLQEVIGITSVANALCRLGCIVDMG